MREGFSEGETFVGQDCWCEGKCPWVAEVGVGKMGSWVDSSNTTGVHSWAKVWIHVTVTYMGTRVGTASDSPEEVQLPCYKMLWNKKREPPHHAKSFNNSWKWRLRWKGKIFWLVPKLTIFFDCKHRTCGRCMKCDRNVMDLPILIQHWWGQAEVSWPHRCFLSLISLIEWDRRH